MATMVIHSSPFSLDGHSLPSKEMGYDKYLDKFELNELNVKLDISKLLPLPSSLLCKPLDFSTIFKRFKDLDTSFVYTPTDTILITRPLKELFSHICNYKLPSLELIARAIKTLVLSIFTWHLCDQVLLEQKNGLNETIISQYSNNTIEMDALHFASLNPYLLENAYRLNPKQHKVEDHEFDYDSLSSDNLRAYFKKCYHVRITPYKHDNTIHDLFRSKELTLKQIA